MKKLPLLLALFLVQTSFALDVMPGYFLIKKWKHCLFLRNFFKQKGYTSDKVCISRNQLFDSDSPTRFESGVSPCDWGEINLAMLIASLKKEIKDQFSSFEQTIKDYVLYSAIALDESSDDLDLAEYALKKRGNGPFRAPDIEKERAAFLQMMHENKNRNWKIQSRKTEYTMGKSCAVVNLRSLYEQSTENENKENINSRNTDEG